MKGYGFRIVVLRVYEGDDEKLADLGAELSFTGYHSNAGLPEYRLLYDVPQSSDDEIEAAWNDLFPLTPMPDPS